jgi:hypothetical protein
MPSFRNITSNSNTGSSVSVTPPFSMAGDIWIAVVSSIGSAPVEHVADGWTAAAGGGAFDSTLGQYVTVNIYWAEAVGGVGSFVFGTNGAYIKAAVASISGARSISPVIGGGGSGGTGTSFTHSGMNITVANSLMIGAWGANGPINGPVGMAAFASLGSVGALWAGSETAFFTGPTGGRTGTSAANEAAGYAMIAIAPNSLPTAPGSVSITPTPADRSATVSWTASTDADAEALQYEGEISTNGASGPWVSLFPLTSALSQAVDLSGYSTTTNAIVRVRAWDGVGYGAYGQTSSFTIQHAPTAPVLINPNGGELFTIGANQTLQWTASSDPNDATASLVYEIYLSTNNKASYSLIATTAAGATSYVYNFSGKPAGSQNWVKIRAKDPGGLFGPYDESNAAFTLATDVTPSAPLSLSPASGAYNRASVIRLSFVHNDPGDPMSAFQIDWGTDGGATFPNTTGFVTTTSQFNDFAANTFTAGNITWRVRTKDQAGNISPYSQATFKASTKPTAPTFTVPTGGGSVGEPRPIVQWSSAGQAEYQLRVLDNSNAQLWSSGFLTTATQSGQVGIDLPNGATRKFGLTIKNSDGLASDETVITITVTYTGPNAPTVLLTDLSAQGHILVAITNPPGGTAFSYNDLYRYETLSGEATAVRIATNLQADKQYPDFHVAGGKNYTYFVRAYAQTGTYAESVKQNLTVNFLQFWISHVSAATQQTPGDYALTLINTEQDENLSQGVKVFNVRGREYPLASFSLNKSHLPRYTLYCRKGTSEYIKLKTLWNMTGTFFIKDNWGNAGFYIFPDLPLSYQNWGQTSSIQFRRISYTEAK